jgi:hypothetical protein
MQIKMVVFTTISIFLRDRSIHENYILVQESAKIRKNMKCHCLLLKLDIAKAFDRVRMAIFIRSVSRERFWAMLEGVDCDDLGFFLYLHPSKGCSGTKYLARSRPKTGDALSLMLFILVMDALSLLFPKSEDESALSSFPIHQAILQHMSVYADDDISKKFGDRSMLRCNLNKSSISPLIYDDETVHEIGNTPHCQVANLPITYLGLPSGKHARKTFKFS